MIYYKAICKSHDWESGLYLTRAAAIRIAKAHRNSASGAHNVAILEVYIPAGALEIRSESLI